MRPAITPKPQPMGWIPALALFAVVCGLLLFLLPALRCGAGPKRPTEQQLIKAALVQAQTACSQAQQAIKQQNYGGASSRIRVAQDSLGRALGRMAKPAEKPAEKGARP